VHVAFKSELRNANFSRMTWREEATWKTWAWNIKMDV